MSATVPNDLLPLIKPLVDAMTKQMRPLLGLVMIHTVFGAMLVPLLLALLYFSTPSTRKTPLFWVILFDVCIGIAIAIWDDTEVLKVLFNPIAGISRNVYIAFPLVQSLSTWVVDLTLLMRLLAVFPLSSTSRSKFAAILTFPILIKTARISLIVASVSIWSKTVTDVSNPELAISANAALTRSPMLAAEFFCELFDHIYVSTFFLYKLYGGFSRSSTSGRVTNATSDSIAGRIRTLFYIALSNFVFPVLFNITLLIIFYAGNSIDIIYVVPSNTYVTTANSALPPLEFKHANSTTTRIGTNRESIKNPRGNGGSDGTLSFDNFHYGRESKSSQEDSFLDIASTHRQAVEVRRDATGVMHRV